MVFRANTRANHGATTGSFEPPPPPYSWFALAPPRSSNQSPVDPLRSPFEPSRILWPAVSWANTRSFVAFVTFIVTVCLCMYTIPVTYCNVPVDPQMRERIQHEWELKEHAQREEEERKRLNLFWGHVEAHQCKTYGTREYTAVLMNLPMDWERRTEACKATPLEVHGITHLPMSCEDEGDGSVMGRWEIDLYEPDCNTFWNWYKDKESPGCTSHGSGKRRIEHYLENIPKGGDWREFCATTPARFHGMEFAGAQGCFQYNYGTYGLWEIDDIDC